MSPGPGESGGTLATPALLKRTCRVHSAARKAVTARPTVVRSARSRGMSLRRPVMVVVVVLAFWIYKMALSAEVLVRVRMWT